MYCINCGVKLSDNEIKCPLCNTVVPIVNDKKDDDNKLYPSNKMPKKTYYSKVLSGAIIILFLIPLVTTFFSDFNDNGYLDWFGYVFGALIVVYVAFALPIWFRRPNPVIFVPCSFLAVTLYVFYINLVLGGTWFFTFALPVLGGICIITCTMVTLFRYLRKGRLFIVGGCIIALGLLILLAEYLMTITFALSFKGWSIYPLITLSLLGGLLLYLAINKPAREIIERKIFF